MNRPVPGDDLPSERDVLQFFDRALSRETDTLSRRPEILWQQLYNDLKWADPPLDGVLDAELSRRSTTPTRAWILRHSHPQQAEALKLVLDAGATPESCVVGARGDFVAVGAGGTLRRWDSRSGRLLNEFELGPRAQLGFPGIICGTAANGALLCLEDNRSTFRIRDPTSGALRAQLPHETFTIGAAAVTSMNDGVLLEIDGHSLRAWMDEKEAWTVYEEAGDIVACALDEQKTDSGSSGIVVSTTADGVVTVRDVSWFDYDTMEPFVSTTTRWQLRDKGATPAPIVACAAGKTADVVVLADAQGILMICDARTGDVRELIGTPGTAVTCCAVSPDGTTVFAGARDGAITVWDVARRAVSQAFGAHAGPVISCAVSRDGMLFYSGGGDGVRQWDLQRGVEVFSFRPVTGEIRACAVSHAEAALVVATETGALERWWNEGRELANVWGGPYKALAWDVADGGQFLAASFADGTTHIWDIDAMREIRVPGILDGKVTSCSVSPNGVLLAVGTEDGKLRIIDARTGNVERILEAHKKSVACCHIGSDGDLVVSGGADGSFRAWSGITGEERFSVAAHPSGISSCAISADERFAVSCPDKQDLGANLSEPARVWDTHTGAKLLDLEAGASHSIPDCAVSPDAEFIVTAGSADRAVRIWDAQPSRPQGAKAIIRGGPVCIFTPDGESIVTGWGRTLAVLNASSGEQRFTLDHGGPTWACDVSPDGDFIVTGGDEAIIRIWDAHTGEKRQELRPTVGVGTGLRDSAKPFAVAVSPGADLVASEENFRVRLWDLESGDDWVIEGGHAAFTPDGASVYGASEEGAPVILDIVSGSANSMPDVSSSHSSSSGIRFTFSDEGDGVLSVRDVHTEVEHRTIRAHPKELKVSATSPDGRFTVTGGDDAMLKVWDHSTADLVAEIPLPAVPMRLSLHPYAPFIACTDYSGNVNRMELVGIEYGPIPVTAAQGRNGPTLRCPKCWTAHTCEKKWLGQVIICPTQTCDLRLQVSTFVVREGSKTLRRSVGRERAMTPGAQGAGEDSVGNMEKSRDLQGLIDHAMQLDNQDPVAAKAFLEECIRSLTPPTTPEEEKALEVLEAMLSLSQPQVEEERGDLLTRMNAWSDPPEEKPKRGWFRRRRR